MFSAAFAAENIKPQFLCISVNSYFEAVFKTVLLCEFKKLAVIIKSLYSFVYLSRKLASLFETDSINFGFKGDSVYYCEIFIISVAAYALCKKNIDNCKIGSAGFYFKECNLSVRGMLRLCPCRQRLRHSSDLRFRIPQQRSFQQGQLRSYKRQEQISLQLRTAD